MRPGLTRVVGMVPDQTTPRAVQSACRGEARTPRSRLPSGTRSDDLALGLAWAAVDKPRRGGTAVRLARTRARRRHSTPGLAGMPAAALAPAEFDACVGQHPLQLPAPRPRLAQIGQQVLRACWAARLIVAGVRRAHEAYVVADDNGRCGPAAPAASLSGEGARAVADGRDRDRHRDQAAVLAQAVSTAGSSRGGAACGSARRRCSRCTSASNRRGIWSATAPSGRGGTAARRRGPANWFRISCRCSSSTRIAGARSRPLARAPNG